MTIQAVPGGYNIVRYVGLVDVGTIVCEGLSREKAMLAAAEMNVAAERGTAFAIERW